MWPVRVSQLLGARRRGCCDGGGSAAERGFQSYDIRGEGEGGHPLNGGGNSDQGQLTWISCVFWCVPESAVLGFDFLVGAAYMWWGAQQSTYMGGSPASAAMLQPASCFRSIFPFLPDNETLQRWNLEIRDTILFPTMFLYFSQCYVSITDKQYPISELTTIS